MCKTTNETIKKFNGCNKKELASVLRDNNISYEEISDHVIGFDFGHLMEEVYALPKIVISKLADYLNDHHIDIDGIFYYETKNEDGATNKDGFQNIKNSSLISLSNIKYDLKNYWKMSTLSVFFSENNVSRVNNILSGRVKWNSEEEYDNILFFKTGKGTYHPSIAERYLINVDLFNKVSNNMQKEICNKVGMPSFILDKILYDDMPVNLTTCDLLLNAYNEVFLTSYKLKDFCKEKDITTAVVMPKEKEKIRYSSNTSITRKRKSPKPYKQNFSVSNIPQDIINGFPKILNKSLSINKLSMITGVPYTTLCRMVEKMKQNKEHYLSLVDNNSSTSIVEAPDINEISTDDKSDKSEIDQKTEYSYTQSIIYDDKDMFKEVKTPSHKSSSSEELDLEMFSRFSPEYLRSVADYLNTLADLKVALKDAENRTKSILSKLS